MKTSEFEHALVEHLQKDPSVQIDDQRILVSFRDRDKKMAEMVEGGVLVRYQGGTPMSYLANGAVLHKAPKFVVTVGGKRDEDSDGVFDLMDQVVASLNGNEVAGFVVAYDGDGFKAEYNGCQWYDITFRVQCTMG